MALGDAREDHAMTRLTRPSRRMALPTLALGVMLACAGQDSAGMT